MGKQSRYIISGGPGSGKSTLIGGLLEAGYPCAAEVSRRMIIQQVALNSDCLPWMDISCFSDRVLQEMVKDWARISPDELTFFDRGIPDIIAYLKFAGISVTDRYKETLKLHPYNTSVFILPPWESIYVQDKERWQTFEEAALIYKVIKETYTEYGFELIELPKTTVVERVAFITSFIQSSKADQNI